MFTRQQVYLMMIRSMITLNFLLLIDLKQYIVPIPLLWCLQRKGGCYNLERYIYHISNVIPFTKMMSAATLIFQILSCKLSGTSMYYYWTWLGC